MAFGETNTNEKIGKENVMENNESFVVNEATENVETTTTEEIVGEQVETAPEKTYTQAELDDIVGKRLARKEAKLRKE